MTNFSMNSLADQPVRYRKPNKRKRDEKEAKLIKAYKFIEKDIPFTKTFGSLKDLAKVHVSPSIGDMVIKN